MGSALNFRAESHLSHLIGLRAQYTKRRDFFVDLLIQKFDIEIKHSSDKSSGVTVYQASLRNSQLKGPIFSFVPPTAGMFVWVRTRGVLWSLS